MDKEKVLEAFRKYLGLNPDDDLNLDMVVLNSSAMGDEEAIDLIMYLEEELGIELVEEDLDNLYTITDIVNYVTKKEETR